jgi:hypothetical protein
MASWETNRQMNTLLIERRDTGNGKQEYKMHPFFRRNDPVNGIFLSPLSMLLFENSQLTFQSIEFLDTPRVPNASQDGDTILTTVDYYQRLSLADLG